MTILCHFGCVILNIHVTLDHFPVTWDISCHFGHCHKRPCFLLVLVERRIIVNSLLSSTLWYYITSWASSLQVVRKICASLKNFLWCGLASRTCSRVKWNNVCASKPIRGLNIIDLEEALNALMAKWILKAFSSRELNLQILLRFKLSKLKSNSRKKWPLSLH